MKSNGLYNDVDILTRIKPRRLEQAGWMGEEHEGKSHAGKYKVVGKQGRRRTDGLTLRPEISANC
jgi:hypothetical protein